MADSGRVVPPVYPMMTKIHPFVIVEQWPSTFLALGTGCMGKIFSTDHHRWPEHVLNIIMFYDIYYVIGGGGGPVA